VVNCSMCSPTCPVILAARRRPGPGKLRLISPPGNAFPGWSSALAHPFLPGSPLRVDEQQLAGGEPDGLDLGPDQVLRRGELVFGERGLDLAGEALQVAGALRAAELDDLLPAGRGQRCGGGPALRQPQDPGRARVLSGDGQRGREGDEQAGAQPVQQPPLVPAGPPGGADEAD